MYAAYGLGRVEKPWRSIDKFSELEDIFLGDKACNEAQESISECKLSEEDGDREGCMQADVSKDVTLKSDDMSEKSIAAGKINTVIFDLDGTLLYTIEDLAASTNYALQQYGMQERTLEEVTAFVGNGAVSYTHLTLPTILLV